MVNSNSSSKKTIQERSRLHHQRQRLIPTIMITSFGVILIGLAIYFIINAGSAQASFDYDADDVVHDHPIKAVHEMSETALESVQFLPQDGPQPKIVLLEDFYNFGVVGSNEVVSHDFVISNQGEASLIISRAYTTCGCTTAYFTATIIAPGKVAVMTMIYDAGFHDARGQTVRRGIIIENNDPKNPQVELWAQATVRDTP
ncbi:MAG: DUF1573 domain-containing protein [Anaerolineales bacterium]|nr:DUF1573 domain-containing protein [Chloroflexota bacterium]MBL6980343.1 DUF1573 domain-containing protein [Anaerolineales bacterium]